MGFGSRRPTRIPLFNPRHRVSRLAYSREHRYCSVEDWKRVAWSDELRLLNANGRPRIWCQAHEIMVSPCQFGTVQGLSDSIIVWVSFVVLFAIFEQGVKGHHPAPTILAELKTALANIWQFIPVEHFQKFAESIPRRVAAIFKAGGDPTGYYVGNRQSKGDPRGTQTFSIEQNVLDTVRRNPSTRLRNIASALERSQSSVHHHFQCEGKPLPSS
ncbi:transposable element Tc1 transposase [Trichonephila clavipes]|nr:transposable element Tc1 transposase [Trichonephila clavipes]